VTSQRQRVPPTMLHAVGHHDVADRLDPAATDPLALAPFQVRWLVTDPAYPPYPSPR
jgi:hypothetical protein